MELSGKAPVIICEDANLDKAVKSLWFLSIEVPAQNFICVNRILAPTGIYDAFLEEYTVTLKGFSLSDGMDDKII